MEKIVVGICDDLPAALRHIENIIAKYIENTEVELEIYKFLSGKEVLGKIQDIDILFLDIDMPEMDGIEVGKEIRRRESKCKIIMATSKIERFKETYKIKAFRFVSKPFDDEEVIEALDDAIQEMIGLETIELYEKRQLYKVRQRDIFLVKSYGSYVEVLIGKHWMRKSCGLTEIEKELNAVLFYKIDKKNVVNMLHIEAYDNGNIRIGNENIKIARRRKKEFERAYWEFDSRFGEV